MNQLLTLPLLLVALSTVALWGCSKEIDDTPKPHLGHVSSADTLEADAQAADDLDADCNQALLAALPPKTAISEVKYAYTQCGFNTATRGWEEGEHFIQVKIFDSKATLPTQVESMEKMMAHSNALILNTSIGIVQIAVRTRDEALADPVILQAVGGEPYLPLVLETSTGDKAVAGVSRENGSDELTLVIGERFVITVERGDSHLLTDNRKAEGAYQPIISALSLGGLR